MTKKEFYEKWEKGLTDYLRKIDESRIGGYTQKHKNGDPAPHGYIIDKKVGEKDIDLIKQYNILSNPEDFESMVGKVHKGARHLNSSQVLCYNFFRPLVIVDSNNSKSGKAGEKLIHFVKENLGISISEKAICYFEYEDEKTKNEFKAYGKTRPKGEESQFDFFIKERDTEIFFEIKYTEATFGGWSPRQKNADQIENHCAYVEKGYKPMLEKSLYFTQACKNAMQDTEEKDFADASHFFNKQYQLFRNALRADSSKFSVIIYPEANPGPELEFNRFKTNLIDGQNHIIALKWENLTKYMSEEFINKYIKILE